MRAYTVTLHKFKHGYYSRLVSNSGEGLVCTNKTKGLISQVETLKDQLFKHIISKL